MPNLKPPVTTVALAAAYRDRILAALPAGSDFAPLMTAYLTDSIDRAEIERGFAEQVWVAAKLYPAGATTHSTPGVARKSVESGKRVAVRLDLGGRRHMKKKKEKRKK